MFWLSLEGTLQHAAIEQSTCPQNLYYTQMVIVRRVAKGTVPHIEFTYLRYVGCGLRKQKKTSTQLLMLRFNTKKKAF